MRMLLVALLVSLILEPTEPPTPSEILTRAQDAYSMGDFVTAQTLLERALILNPGDAIIQLNLGHVYLQQGNIGLAILVYRRAQQSIPREVALAQGLALARSLRSDIQEADISLPGQLSAATRGILTLSELFLLTLMASILLSVAVALRIAIEQWIPLLRVGLPVMVSVTAVLIVLLITRAWMSASRPDAVVIQPLITVRSGPGPDYLELYELRAGAEMRVISARSGWYRFELSDGREGWIKADGVGLIRGEDDAPDQ